MSRERIEADYLIETASPPQAAAESMAGEQSSGTFVPIPVKRPSSRRAQLRGSSGWRWSEKWRAAPARLGRPRTGRRAGDGRDVTLSWPLGNIGPSLPNLMATVAGNLFELKQFSGIRMLDMRLPDPFAGKSRPQVRRRRHTRIDRRARPPVARHHRQADYRISRPNRPPSS